MKFRRPGYRLKMDDWLSSVGGRDRWLWRTDSKRSDSRRAHRQPPPRRPRQKPRHRRRPRARTFSGTCREPGSATSGLSGGRGSEGEPVRLEDTRLKLESIRLARSVPASSDGEIKGQTAQGKFVILKVKVANTGSKPMDWSDELDGRTQLLVGSKTFSHSGDVEFLLDLADDPMLSSFGESIPPDGSASSILASTPTSPEPAYVAGAVVLRRVRQRQGVAGRGSRSHDGRPDRIAPPAVRVLTRMPVGSGAVFRPRP